MINDLVMTEKIVESDVKHCSKFLSKELKYFMAELWKEKFNSLHYSCTFPRYLLLLYHEGVVEN